MQGQRFRIKEKAYGQYAQSYFVRLTLMRPILTARAAKDFPGVPGELHASGSVADSISARMCYLRAARLHLSVGPIVRF